MNLFNTVSYFPYTFTS